MSFNPKYTATPPTLSEGQFSSGYVDQTGALRVSAEGATTGTTSDAAWNGSDADASTISLLKAIYNKLVEIEVNTTPTP